jgi:hypothetical protein
LAARSGGEINGIPIPLWFPETLLTRSALETLYARFGLEAMRREPELRIETDAARGVFALRLRLGDHEIVANVDACSFSAGEATLSARAGDRTAHATVRLSGSERNVPIEVRIDGLGGPYDQLYQPAGAWRGGARQVFQTPSDELASEQLAGIWSSPTGQTTTLSVEGENSYRIRSGAAVYVPDLDAAAAPADLLLRPASGAGTGWALTLRGPNAMERIPCRFEAGQASCVPEGAAETLRRVGARLNVH